jgi:hypothetical protein
MKVVGLSALHTDRSCTTGYIPGTDFSYWLSRPQYHSVAGRMKSTKAWSNPIGKWTRDLPACSAVPPRYGTLNWIVMGLCDRKVQRLMSVTYRIFPAVIPKVILKPQRKETYTHDRAIRHFGSSVKERLNKTMEFTLCPYLTYALS